MKTTVPATQMACSKDYEENIAKADTMIRNPAATGAQIIFLQKVFSIYEFQFMEMEPGLFFTV